MKFIRNIDEMPQENVVLTIGFFDGVHCGHRYLIDYVRKIACEKQLKSAVLTFWPHPRMVLHEKYQPKLLNTNDEKISLIETLPIDYCIQIPFTQLLSSLSAYEFMSVLKTKLHVCQLIIGYDHRFGHNREEGFEQYCEYGKLLHINVVKAPVYEQDGRSISSSYIRSLILSSEIKKANSFLGYEYELTGRVGCGKKIGRTLGFPTANLIPDSEYKIIPAAGVYAVRVEYEGKVYQGVTCVGNCPTLGSDNKTTIETNLFDFDEELYGREISLRFVDYIRPLQKFPTLEALRCAMTKDVEQAKKKLEH